MAAGEDDKKSEGKGFAGLSSLVSDIDVPAQPEPVKGVPPIQAQATAGTPSPPPPRQLPAPTASTPPTSGSSVGKWILGIAAVIGLLWFIGQSNKGPSSSSPTYSPSVETQTPYTAPNPVAKPQVSKRPSEETPPAGQGHSLSLPQIRYCVAEDIRLNGARSAVNNYIDAHVDQFNAMVADYNSRCGQFRYRRGAFESARQDIEPYRGELEAEGRGRFESARNTQSYAPRQTYQESQPKTGSPTNQPARPEPDSTVLAIQKRLNQLGYDAGVADGFAGSGTRAAIMAFQRDKGMNQDGLASSELLGQLERQTTRISRPNTASTSPSLPLSPSPAPTPAPEGVSPKPSVPANAFVSGSNWYCKDGFKKVVDRCEAVIPPENGFVSGANWYCKEGFKRVGDQCDAVAAPRNAFVSGANWYCKEGFRRVGDQCEAVIAPANAFVSGANWYCKEGFKRIGDQCDAVIPPQNAFVSGANWYCKEGFKRVGDQCAAVIAPANAFVSGANWYCKEGFKKSGEKCVSVLE